MSGSLAIVNSGPCPPAWNMALDEALLLRAPEEGRAVLRFYGWTDPAATFGYFQRHAEVAAATFLRPLIRRPTGGGLVPHDADWTYSLTVPPGSDWHSLRAEDSYRTVHEWVAAAFARLGAPAELASCCRKEIPGRCFAGHEKHDVLWHGRKIAGAAQRRNRLGLLIQGSVQPPPGVGRGDWEAAMNAARPRHHFAESAAALPPQATRALADRLAEEKYSRTGYNERR